MYSSNWMLYLLPARYTYRMGTGRGAYIVREDSTIDVLLDAYENIKNGRRENVVAIDVAIELTVEVALDIAEHIANEGNVHLIHSTDWRRTVSNTRSRCNKESQRAWHIGWRSDPC